MSTGGGLVAFLLKLGCIYLFGLLVHGIQRLTYKLIKKIKIGLGIESTNQMPSDSAWYCGLGHERREDLALYFWYLRATCWNLAVTVPICMVWAIIKAPPINLPWILVTGLVLLVVFIYLGFDFQTALQHAMVKGRKEAE